MGTSEQVSSLRCRCSALVPYAFEELGCVECGTSCCPACGFFLESVWYCACCAGALLEAPDGAPHPTGAPAPERAEWRPGG
jgi:hypothetical protein